MPEKPPVQSTLEPTTTSVDQISSKLDIFSMGPFLLLLVGLFGTIYICWLILSVSMRYWAKLQERDARRRMSINEAGKILMLPAEIDMTDEQRINMQIVHEEADTRAKAKKHSAPTLSWHLSRHRQYDIT